MHAVKTLYYTLSISQNNYVRMCYGSRTVVGSWRPTVLQRGHILRPFCMKVWVQIENSTPSVSAYFNEEQSGRVLA